jgi:RimJ/RimL family protein N-acetyltransferase
VLHDPANPSSFTLRPFVPSYAGSIAGWVESAEQKRWVAPSTIFPLTAEKVIHWKKAGGRVYVLVSGDSPESPEIMAYGELNPMRQVPTDHWLGHLIVRPEHRGRGVGKTLVLGLLERAFQCYDAQRVSLVVFPDNRAAIACYCRCGFQIIKEECHSFVEDGPKHRLLRLEIHARDAISFLPNADGRRELAVV